MIIRQEQFDELQGQCRKDFLLGVISDWYVLYKMVYGCPPKTEFEPAWDIGDSILARLDQELFPPGEQPARELIHEALLATEKGVAADQLEWALNSFCHALPSTQAAFVLFRASVMPDSPDPEGSTAEHAS